MNAMQRMRDRRPQTFVDAPDICRQAGCMLRFWQDADPLLYWAQHGENREHRMSFTYDNAKREADSPVAQKSGIPFVARMELLFSHEINEWFKAAHEARNV